LGSNIVPDAIIPMAFASEEEKVITSGDINIKIQQNIEEKNVFDELPRPFHKPKSKPTSSNNDNEGIIIPQQASDLRVIVTLVPDERYSEYCGYGYRITIRDSDRDVVGRGEMKSCIDKLDFRHLPIAVGESFTVCANTNEVDLNGCERGVNGEEKKPERVTVIVS
jgi:hypothetical protein